MSFFILNTWRLGRDALEVPDSFNNNLEERKGIEELFHSNLASIKGEAGRLEAEHQFTSKTETIMKRYLKHYVDEPSFYA